MKKSMKYIYVGNHEFGRYAAKKEIEKEGGKLIEKTAEQGACFVEDMTTDLIKEAADVYIFDVSSLLDRIQNMVEEFDKVYQATNSVIIIYAPGYNPDSKLLVNLQAIGLVNQITEPENIGLLQEQFAALLQKPQKISEEKQEELLQQREKFYEEVVSENPQLEKIAPPPKDTFHVQIVKRKPGSMIKIAVVGSQSRIGTTTTALQLTKFLNLQEDGSAAYMEYDQSGYTLDCKKLYDCSQDSSRLGCVTIQNVDMHYDPRKINDICRQGYDFLIYDYGNIDKLQNLSSLFEKDIILLVCGGKANEFQKTTDAMRRVFDQKQVFYVFNYLFSEKDQNWVRNQQGLKSDQTYFLQQVSDIFVYNPEHDTMFFQILNADYEQKDAVDGKKGKWRRMFKGRV